MISILAAIHKYANPSEYAQDLKADVTPRKLLFESGILDRNKTALIGK